MSWSQLRERLLLSLHRERGGVFPPLHCQRKFSPPSLSLLTPQAAWPGRSEPSCREVIGQMIVFHWECHHWDKRSLNRFQPASLSGVSLSLFMSFLAGRGHATPPLRHRGLPGRSQGPRFPLPRREEEFFFPGRLRLSRRRRRRGGRQPPATPPPPPPSLHAG